MITYGDASKVPAAELVNAMKPKWNSSIIGALKKKWEYKRHRKAHNWTAQKQRTRTWACRFPDALAGGYTECMRAIGGAIAANLGPDGTCTKSQAEIAAIAGCSITSVQNFLYWASEMKHIVVIRRPVIDRFGNHLHRNLTNIVRIVSKVWLKFLRMLREMASRSIGGGGFKNSRSSKQEDSFFIRPAVATDGGSGKSRLENTS